MAVDLDGDGVDEIFHFVRDDYGGKVAEYIELSRWDPVAGGWQGRSYRYR